MELLTDRTYCTYINKPAGQPSLGLLGAGKNDKREAPQTPRERLLTRLLARDFLRETHRERLLGAGEERNNQPSMEVAKVMDRTAAGEG